MIRSEEEFQQAVEQIERMYRALGALRARTGLHPQQFELLSEGPVEEIRRLQSDLDGWLGTSVASSEHV